AGHRRDGRPRRSGGRRDRHRPLDPARPRRDGPVRRPLRARRAPGGGGALRSRARRVRPGDVTEALVSGDGCTPVFVTAGAQAVFALVLAALLAGVVLLTHAKKPAEKAPPARPAQLAVVLGLVLVC